MISDTGGLGFQHTYLQEWGDTIQSTIPND